MGALRITSAQWAAMQANIERPRITRIFQQFALGQPAPYNASGPSDPASATHWVFDDHRLSGYWRVRVIAGPSVAFQEWDALVGGSMIREVSLAQMNVEFGSV